MHLLVQGFKKDSTLSTYLVTVASLAGQGELVLETTEITRDFFEGVKNADVMDLYFCSKTEQFVVQTAGEVLLYGAEFEASSVVAKRQGTLTSSKPDAKILKVEQGQVVYREDGMITALSILREDPQRAECVKSVDEGQTRLTAETSEQQLLSGSPIDPATVKIEDIKRYEALMKGRAVSAISNASSLRGLVESESTK